MIVKKFVNLETDFLPKCTPEDDEKVLEIVGFAIQCCATRDHQNDFCV